MLNFSILNLELWHRHPYGKTVRLLLYVFTKVNMEMQSVQVNAMANFFLVTFQANGRFISLAKLSSSGC